MKPMCMQSDGDEALKFLQRVCANDVAQPVGTVLHTAMLNKHGCYENDCSIARIDPHSFLIVSAPEQVFVLLASSLCFTLFYFEKIDLHFAKQFLRNHKFSSKKPNPCRPNSKSPILSLAGKIYEPRQSRLPH